MPLMQSCSSFQKINEMERMNNQVISEKAVKEGDLLWATSESKNVLPHDGIMDWLRDRRAL